MKKGWLNYIEEKRSKSFPFPVDDVIKNAKRKISFDILTNFWEFLDFFGITEKVNK